MKKIVIIDYGCGNILNLVRALDFLGYKSEATKDKKKIINSSHLILPGVGAFGNAMQLLEKNDLIETIKEYVKFGKKPLLGICLGMQVLLSKSKEHGIHKGLNLIEGEVIKIASSNQEKIKVPHIGWNEIYPNKDIKALDNKFFDKAIIGKSFYFVHSYIGITTNPQFTLASCNYSGVNIPSVIKSENIMGCQFHPEKSDKNGLKFLQNFCEIE
tara:strand:+ start:1960 stop:2601 length:642 start_codon:yes stop_codon:yes gene_type:complete